MYSLNQSLQEDKEIPNINSDKLEVIDIKTQTLTKEGSMKIVIPGVSAGMHQIARKTPH